MKNIASPGSPSAKMVWRSAHSRSSSTAARLASASSSSACSAAICLSSSRFIGLLMLSIQELVFLVSRHQSAELLRMIRLAESVLLSDQSCVAKFAEGLLHRAHALARAGLD